MSTKNLRDHAGVVIFPPLLYLLFIVAGTVANKFFPAAKFPTALTFVGIPNIAVGLWMLVSTAKTLNRYNTAVNPSGSTTTIVKAGLFNKTRNPMYISFNLIYFGIALLLNSPLALLLMIPLLVVVQRGIVLREEKYLLRKFGREYKEYQLKVKRWI